MKKYLKFFLVFGILCIIPLILIGSSNIIINSINNDAKLFNDIIDNTPLEIDSIKQIVQSDQSVSHPTDTHPSLVDRLHYLKIDLDDLLKELYISEKEENAASLINDIEKVEENISLAEQHIYIEQHKIDSQEGESK